MNRVQRIELWWPVAFALAFIMPALLAAIFFLGSKGTDASVMSQLTLRGEFFFRPERDVAIYLLGCAVLPGLLAALAWGRRRHSSRGEIAADPHLPTAARQLVAVILLAVQQTVWILLLRRWLLLGISPNAPLVAAGLLATVALSIFLVGAWPFLAPKGLIRWLGAVPQERALPAIRFQPGLDLTVPLLLAAVIYVPFAANLAGKFFLNEELHHWDFFTVGPALAFQHGKALGTEAYAQYGVAWPLLLNALTLFVPLGYGGAIHMATMAGVVYFTAIYALLRAVTGNALWSAAGVFLAVGLQLFRGLDDGDVMWQWPSSTFMRAPTDVVFLFAAWMYLRTPRPGWAGLIGAAVGLGLAFETDTGLYLTVALIVFWIFSIEKPVGKWTITGRHAGLSIASAVMVLLPILAVASRGTILQSAFWTGWTESLRSYGAGVSMIPLAVVPDAHLAFFIVVLIIYLGAAGLAFMALLRGRSHPRGIFLGTLGCYGALTMVLFIGRSHPFNLFHVIVPFTLMVTALGAWTDTRELIRRPWMRRAVPWGALAASIVALACTPACRNYPGLLQTWLRGAPPEGLRIPSPAADVGGLPIEAGNFVDAFKATLQAIRERSGDGDVAVLDDADTIYQLGANIPPWWRYSPSFTAITRKSEVRKLREALLQHPPKYIVIRPDDRHATGWHTEDVWAEIHAFVQSRYTLEVATGLFEVWRHN